MLRNEKTIIKNLFEIKLFEHIGTFGFLAHGSNNYNEFIT